jgi:hypothetical protein
MMMMLLLIVMAEWILSIYFEIYATMLGLVCLFVYKKNDTLFVHHEASMHELAFMNEYFKSKIKA